MMMIVDDDRNDLLVHDAFFASLGALLVLETPEVEWYVVIMTDDFEILRFGLPYIACPCCRFYGS